MQGLSHVGANLIMVAAGDNSESRFIDGIDQAMRVVDAP